VSFHAAEGRLHYWHAFRTHALLIAGITALAVGAALVVIFSATKQYSTSAALQVQPMPAYGTDPFQGFLIFRQPADGSSPAVGAASIFGTPRYTEVVRARLGKAGSGVELSATPQSQADMITLGATAPTPRLAARAANTYAAVALKERKLLFRRELRQRIGQIQLQIAQIPAAERTQNPVYQSLAAQVGALRGFVGAADPTIREVTRARVPLVASWPRPKQTLVIAFVIGLLLGIAAAIALELVNPRFTREDDLIVENRLPVLARMPRLPRRLAAAYANGEGSLPPAAWKSYRTLRAVLATAGGDGNRFPRSILVTGGGPGDGKTFTAVNLAIALSSSGLRVTLIDADIPRPTVATMFGIRSRRDGFSRLLRNPEAEDVKPVRAPGHDRLNLLLSAPEQISQLHLYSAGRLERVLARLQKNCDIVVIDSPPLPEVVETLALADVAEAVVICARIGHTRRDKVAELRNLLARRGVTPLGFFVTTRERMRATAQYGYPMEIPSFTTDRVNGEEELIRSRAPASSVDGS
jgi:Mrp family chromosome partitioning ATPase